MTTTAQELDQMLKEAEVILQKAKEAKNKMGPVKYNDGSKSVVFQFPDCSGNGGAMIEMSAPEYYHFKTKKQSAFRFAVNAQVVVPVEYNDKQPTFKITQRFQFQTGQSPVPVSDSLSLQRSMNPASVYTSWNRLNYPPTYFSKWWKDALQSEFLYFAELSMSTLLDPKSDEHKQMNELLEKIDCVKTYAKLHTLVLHLQIAVN